jgi:hypothetical protein
MNMPELREFASSSNGDRWFLARDDETMHAYVVHRANAPSGGKESRVGLDAFISGRAAAPEQDALLRLIGTLVEDSIDNIEYTEG